MHDESRVFILHHNMVKRYKKSDPIHLRLHWCINRPGVQKHRVSTAIHWKREKPRLNPLFKKKGCEPQKIMSGKKAKLFVFPFLLLESS